MTPWRAAFDPLTVSGRLLITKSEAAEQLGVSLRTIERLIAAGHLPLVHVEGAARVRVADLGAYVQGLDADKKPPVIRRVQMTTARRPVIADRH